jgi:nucleotide-binding universal stress UspA family protein
MAIRRIFVPIRGDGKGEKVLDHALVLARRFKAHIEAVHCRPSPEDLIPFGVAVPAVLREQIAQSGNALAAAEEAKIKGEFEDYVASRKLTMADAGTSPTGKTTVSFAIERGKQAAVVSSRGRLADIIAVARPDRERNIGRNTLEAALLNTGSLVLMCPPSKPGAIGEHVAIAWNGSREAARAVALAHEVLREAKKVTVLTVAEAANDLTGGDLVAYLADHGIKATHVEISGRGGIGKALLAAARGASADTLLMGAYGSSRGRELVFGGVTQHVVDKAEMPVLLNH